MAFENGNGHDGIAMARERKKDLIDAITKSPDGDTGMPVRSYEQREDQNGQISSEGYFSKGNREGFWIMYDRTDHGQYSRKHSGGNFHRGEPYGLWTFWDEYGNEKTEEY